MLAGGDAPVKHDAVPGPAEGGRGGGGHRVRARGSRAPSPHLALRGPLNGAGLSLRVSEAPRTGAARFASILITTNPALLR